MNFFNQIDFKIFIFAVFIGLTFFSIDQVNAQQRDHLTAEEIEIVRDVQSIDFRMLVFIKAIERRFMAIDGADKLTKEQLKQNEKDLENWGELPKGTKTQLLSDIDKIIDEAISKIEDVADRDVESDLLPIAVHIMSDRAKLFIPRLEAYSEKATTSREIAVLNSSIKNCNEIIDASAKVKRPSEKELNKRTKKL